MIALPAAAMTERPHLLLDRPQVDPGPAGGDPLSGLLHTVRLTGSVFFRVDAGTPWEAQVPDGASVDGPFALSDIGTAVTRARARPPS